MKKYLIACSLFLLSALPAFAQSSYVVKDGNGVLQTIRSVDCAGVICPASVPIDSNGNLLGVAGNPFFMAFATGATLPAFSATPTVNIGNINGAPPSLTNPLFVSPAAGASFNVVCTSGCGGGGGGGLSVPFLGPIGLNGTPGGFKDATGNLQPLLGDVTNGQWVNVKASVSIPVTGTFFQATQPVSATSLPLPTGAATQTTLASILTNLGSPFQAGASIGNTSFAATQATASALNATVVGTGTFAVQSSPTSASTWGINTLGSTTAGQSGQLSLGAVTTAAPTYTTAQTNALSLTTAGLLRVDGSGVTQPVSAASLPLPTGAATSANQTNATQKTQIVDGSGNVIAATTNALNVAIVSGGGSGGTASSFAAVFPATGTAAGMSQGGNMVALTGTAGNLNVQCANCSGSGVSTADKAAFVAGTSLFAGGGGFFQTTATTNPLTTGQQGLFQVTAQRALFSNLRDSSGNELGVAAAPVQVSLANTAANGTALLVTGTGGTFPVSQATAASLNATVVGTGTFAVQAAPTSAPAWGINTLGSTTVGQSGELALGAVTTAAPTYTTAQTNALSLTTAGALRVDGSAVTQPVSLTSTTVTGTVAVTQSGAWSLTANQSVNVAQVNGVTPLMGNGVTGTGSQRVTIASDNTAFAVNATVTQATSANLKAQVDPLTPASWGIGTSTQNSAVATNGQLALGQFNTTPTTITTGNMSPLQMDAAGNLLVNIKAGSSSGAVAQGSTTAGQTGGLTQAAVTTAAPTYTTAQTSPLSLTTAGALRVDGSGVTQPVSLTSTTVTGTVAVTQSGSWSLAANQSVNVAQINGITPLMGNGVTGTGSQRVTIASDNTAFSVNATVTQATSSNLKAQVDPLTPASWGIATATQNSASATNGQLALAQFNTTPTTITTGNMSPMQLDASGNLKVNIIAGASSGAVAQGSTTAGQTGGLTQAAVTTAAPTYTTAQTSPLSLTTAGELRTFDSQLLAAANGSTPAGANIIGKVGIDQTTPGTTNLVALAANQSVNVAQVAGTTTATGSGVMGAGTQRIALATDSPGIVGLVSNATSAVATTALNVPTNGYGYAFNGTTWDQLQVDGSKFLKVNCAAGCTGAADTTAALSGMTVNGAATQIALVGTSSVSVLLSGTWTATITPEVSADGGTTWVATQFWNVNTHTAVATVSANGTYDIMGTGGKSQARVHITAFTSGTVTGNLKATSQAPSTNDGLIALTGTQPVNLAQVAGASTAVGSGVQATALRTTLATDSPGIVTLGQTTKSASVPVAIASDQVGTAGTAAANVLTVQGIASMTAINENQTQVNGVAILTGTGAVGTGAQRIAVGTDTATIAGSAPGTAGSASANVVTVQGVASMTPVIANQTNGYPSGAIAETISTTGTTAATTATLAAAVGKTTYICGFSMRSVATSAAAGNATVTGTITGTMNFTHGTGATPTVIPNDQRFRPCVPASTTNTTISVVSPAAGTGGVMSVTAWGFQL